MALPTTGVTRLSSSLRRADICHLYHRYGPNVLTQTRFLGSDQSVYHKVCDEMRFLLDCSSCLAPQTVLIVHQLSYTTIFTAFERQIQICIPELHQACAHCLWNYMTEVSGALHQKGTHSLYTPQILPIPLSKLKHRRFTQYQPPSAQKNIIRTTCTSTYCEENTVTFSTGAAIAIAANSMEMVVKKVNCIAMMRMRDNRQ